MFNRYGSREVGDIACERPGVEGLWIAPWGNYVEIVDEKGNPVPDGVEGEILITSLTNYAMPLLRYQIGDYGVLAPQKDTRYAGRIFQGLLGRSGDMFRTRNGTVVDGGYLEYQLYYKDWIDKFQIVQRSYSSIVYRIVRSGSDFKQAELARIAAKTKLVMGDDCNVAFEFVDDIPTSGSGKFRYYISEVQS